MKVLSIGDYSSNLSVYEAQVMLLIGIKKSGIDLSVQGHFSDEIKEIFEQNNVPLIYDKPNSKKDKNFIKRLKNTITENQFKIVHVFGGKNTSNACFAAKKLNIRVIGYFGSTSIHWYDPFAYLSYLNPRLDRIIVISDDIKRHLKKQLFRKNKPAKIYKGYHPDWFSKEVPFDYTTIGIPKEAVIVCSAGTHRPVKGMKFLLEATHFLKNKENVHFVFAGTNTNANDMKKLVEDSPLSKNIHLLGFRKDIKSIIKGADIYSQTSIDEGLGRTIIEAMCMSKPVVITKAGGCIELIEDTKSGLLAENSNPESIAQKLDVLLSNKEKRTQMGNEALERINTTFHINVTVQHTINLYKEELENL